jgi:hypothetical protein
MHHRRSRIVFVIAFVALVTLAFLFWRPLFQAWNLYALRSASGGSTIVHGDNLRPVKLPESVDKAMMTLLARVAPDSARREAYREMFHSLFRDPPEGLAVICTSSLDPEFATVLARFQSLRTLHIKIEREATQNEGDMERIFTAARALPKLEKLTLQSTSITDASMIPLRGHPTLRSLVIAPGSFTPRCVETLRTLPSLREAFLAAPYATRSGLSREDRMAIFRALPSVHVVLY